MALPPYSTFAVLQRQLRTALALGAASMGGDDVLAAAQVDTAMPDLLQTLGAMGPPPPMRPAAPVRAEAAAGAGAATPAEDIGESFARLFGMPRPSATSASAPPPAARRASGGAVIGRRAPA